MVDALSGTRARVLTIGADRLDEETRALLGGEEADAKLEELLAEAASARPEDGLSTVWG